MFTIQGVIFALRFDKFLILWANQAIETTAKKEGWACFNSTMNSLSLGAEILIHRLTFHRCVFQNYFNTV